MVVIIRILKLCLIIVIKYSFAFQERKPVEPSDQFIRTYFSTFKNDPVVAAMKDYKVNINHIASTVFCFLFHFLYGLSYTLVTL